MKTRALLILMILLVPGLTLAQIIPINESRYVEAFFEIDNSQTQDFYSDGDYQEAFNFEDFDAEAFADVNFMNTFCESNAWQISSIGQDVLRANLSAGGYADNLDPAVTVASYSYSSYEVEFQIDGPHTYYLSGYGDLEGNGWGHYALIDDFGLMIHSGEMIGGGIDVLETGSLTAGRYWLIVDVSLELFLDGPGGDGGISELDLTLEMTPSGTSSVGDPLGAGYLRAGPNPMAGATDIAFAIGKGQPVTIEVLDIRGRRIRTFESAGSNEGVVHWDGRTDRGRQAPSGTYFLRARSGDEMLQSKVTMVR